MRRVMDSGKLLLVLDLDHTLLNSTRTAEVCRACSQAPSCTSVSQPTASSRLGLRRSPGVTLSRCAAGGRSGARAAGGAAGGGGSVRRAGQPAPPAAPQPVDQAAAGRARVPGGRARALRAAHLHARRGLVRARHGRPARPGRPPVRRAHPLAGAPRQPLYMSQLHWMLASKTKRLGLPSVCTAHGYPAPCHFLSKCCLHPGTSRADRYGLCWLASQSGGAGRRRTAGSGT